MEHYHGDYLAEITHRLEVPFLILLAVRHNNLCTHSGCNEGAFG